MTSECQSQDTVYEKYDTYTVWYICTVCRMVQYGSTTDVVRVDLVKSWKIYCTDTTCTVQYMLNALYNVFVSSLQSHDTHTGIRNGGGCRS
jgi:hypothetical protein